MERRTLKDTVLLLAGCGMETYEIAEHLNCRIEYVRSTIRAERLRLQKRKAAKTLEARA